MLGIELGALDLTFVELMLAMSAVATGACLQGSLGFGLGLLAAPSLVLIDPALVPGPLLAMGVPLTMLIAWRERSSLDFASIRWAVVGRFPGSIAGSLAVAALTQRWLAVAFALSILAAVGLSTAGLSVDLNGRNLFLAGVVSGVMGTATSVGGPPIALVYQRSSGPELRASMAAFVVFGAFFSLISLTAVGEFGIIDIRRAGILIPAVLAGFALSRWTNRFLDNGYTRPAVLVFAGASAMSILVRQIW